MDTLAGKLDIIRAQIAAYAKPALTGEASYLTQSIDGQMYTVVDVATVNGKRQADVSLAVRVVDDHVIIEHDMNNKPLVDALVQAGIPRTQIILAYAGEVVPGALFTAT